MSQFDREISKAYITDKLHIVRKVALFNCKQAWSNWLGYSRFGSARIASSEAEAQGGRQEEPMCMQFSLGVEAPNIGKAQMRYKFRETDPYWAPYDVSGIPCLSLVAPDNVQDLLRNPGIRQPKAWPEKDGIFNHLMGSKKLQADEKEEWRQFFLCVPECVEDFRENQLFEWKLPNLVQQFRDAKAAAQGPGQGIGDTDRPEKPDERILWAGFTAAEAKRQAKARAANYQREKQALEAKKQSEAITKRRVRTRNRNRRANDGTQEPEPDPDLDPADELHMAAGEMGVVRIGDVVLFSPDDASREKDLRSGYKLGLNIGQVCTLDHDDEAVELWWYFSNSHAWTIKTKFFPWRESKSPHEPYKDWVQVSSLLQDSWGTLVKVNLTWVSGKEGYAKYVLTKESVAIVEEVLQDDD